MAAYWWEDFISVSLQKAEKITPLKDTAVVTPLCSPGKQPLAGQLQTPSLLWAVSIFIYGHSCHYIFRDLMLKFTRDSLCLPGKTVTLSSLYLSSWVARSPVTSGVLMGIGSRLAGTPRWQHCCAAGALAGTASDAAGYHIWAAPPRRYYQPAAVPRAASLFDRPMWWFCSSAFLITNDNAGRNTWTCRTEQCEWQTWFLPTKRSPMWKQQYY